ncbi:DUF3841 domain-containing protein [Bacillus sp. 31A1R]|uniref:DUF3841 domain-containing protein n=1 Tax=Robertmurraya mangrovi TaxID=3098077 RepID=A0ABU5IZY3_9BACI|nr:DUF3841 domain-containing protein [Bacillus sp. 31A1R]MDZ5472701.1 DUF3841 domain-containing protein [Bacillus sp. 31A1R]
MIVYTVKPEKMYHLMRKQGYYEGSEKHIFWPEQLTKPYQWMMKQLAKTIPDYDGTTYPVWVWKRRPNRNEKPSFRKGNRGVILTLDIPDDQILWSCFHKWDFVMTEHPVTITEDEWNRFDQGQMSREEIEQTWERIFDFDLLRNIDPEWNGVFDPNWIQGVTPRITMDQVKRVERFMGKE